MVEESPYLDATDVQEEHGLLHYGLQHAVDDEISSFDQSDVEPATAYQSQADCGSSRSDSDDQMREEPFRDSPTAQTMEKSSNTDSRSERSEVDDVREEQSLFTAKKSFTSESEKGDSVGLPPRQKNSKSKAKKRKVSEDSTLSNQEKISKNKRKKERCRGEDEMANKDAKQNETKRREKERRASYYHLVVPAGTNVINDNGNVNDNGNAHEEVVEEHTVAAMEVVEEQSITDTDENVTCLAGMPALHSPPPVNSKTKYNQAYESKLHENWNTRFMELVEYKEKNGDCNITIKKNGSLGMWIARQRLLFKSKKLMADHHEKLVGIGFVFEDVKVATDNEKWNRHFMELVKYKKENGHCNFPTNKGSLGKWVSKQRVLFKSKELKADRHEKLVGIGFVFEDAKFARDNIKWNILFMKLVEYKKENGHCNFPTNKGSLGIWVSKQRALFKSNKLKADRHEKLVGIGFIFKEKLDQQWQDMYQKLLEHKETKGHCLDLPQTLPLGKWLRKQRWLYRNGKLREDRAEKLVSVGFDDRHGLKKGGAVCVRDAASGQPPRKKRKVLDLDNDLAAITHDEGEEGIDNINDIRDINDNDNDNAHEEIVEEYAVTATELVEEGIKEGQKENVVAPPLEENNEVHEDGPAVSV
jgi:hypothetical protein